MPEVVAYYEKYFKDGRTGGFDGAPDIDHGGIEFLKKLKAAKETWSSDGSKLQAIPEVKTYKVCDKRFDE